MKPKVIKIYLLCAFVVIANNITVFSQTCDDEPLSSNLITNGGFENGDDGSSRFGTHLPHDPNCQAGCFPCSCPGRYYIGDDPLDFNRFMHNGLAGLGPRTGNNMYMVDAANQPDAIVWEQDITVEANKTYHFSAWLSVLFDALVNPMAFEVVLPGGAIETLADFTPIYQPLVWEEYAVDWRSLADQTITIRLRVNATGGIHGNDYGLDDISVTTGCLDPNSGPIPQPADVEECAANFTSANFNSGVITHSDHTFTWYNGSTEIPGQTGPNLTGITTPGTYSVCVDSAGCANLGSATLVINPDPVASATGGAVLCNGDNTGSIDLTVSGGTPTYNFVWDNGAGNSEDPGNLGAGTYNVTVTDANNCTATASADITEPPALSLDQEDKTDTRCSENNGTITLSASGGTAPIEYSIDNGISFHASGSFTNLSAGTYDIVIRDANNCRITSSLILNDAPGPQITDTSLVHPTCGNNNGSIDLTVISGTAPLTFSNNGGGTFGNSDFFNNLGAGNYTLIVRDDNQCTDTVEVTLIMPDGPVIDSILFTNTTCTQANGTVDIYASVTVASLSISFNGGTFGTTSSFSGLSAGTYPVVVQDGNNCQVSQDVTIIDIPGPTIDAVNAQDPSCGLANGSIDITASGTALPLSYSIDNGANYQSSNSFDSLFPGNYDIIVRDTNGCTATILQVLNPQPGPEITDTTLVHPTCGNNNGSIDLTVINGTAPLTFSNDGGGTFGNSNSFNNLGAGNYTLIVLDDNQCSDTVDVTLLTPDGPIIDSILFTNTTCTQANGTVDIYASGTVAPLSISFNGGTFGTTSSFSGLSAGTYPVVVQDGNNCQVSQDVTIIDIPGPTIDAVNAQDPSCGLPNGSIDITASGTALPLSYSIDNGANYQSSNSFDSLFPGNYNIIVRDTNGCTATILQVLNPQPGPEITDTTLVHPTCGNNNGSIDLTVINGTAPLTFSNDGGGTFGNSNSFNNLGAGDYTLIVRDDNQCTDTLEVTLTMPDGPVIDSILFTRTTCTQANGTVDIYASATVEPLTISFNGSAFGTTSSFSGLSAGIYTIIVEDGNGCQETQNVTITDIPGPTINAVNAQYPSCGLANGSIDITTSGTALPLSYSIDNGANYQSSNSFDSLFPGNYDIIVRDTNGCTATILQVLNPQPGPEITDTTLVAPLCGLDNGSITMTVINGTPPLTYSHNGGTDFGNATSFPNLGAGNYQLIAIDSNACSDTLDVTLITPDGPVIDSIIATEEICGRANGTLTVFASGIALPITYSLDAGPFDTDHVFTGLDQGSHLVEIRDANGCESQQSILIGEIQGPNIVGATLTHPTCDSANGSITIHAAGVAAPFTYSLDNSNFQSDSLFSSLGDGNFNIYIRDTNDCPASDVVTLMPNPGPEINTLTNVDPTCGNANGIINVAASGNATPLLFSLDGTNFYDSTQFINKPVGDYLITVRDTNGCIDTLSIALEPTPQPIWVDTTLTHPTCGNNNGSIDALAQGGIAPLNYYLDDVDQAGVSTYNNLFAGVYTLRVRDNNNCEDTLVVSLINSGGPVIDSIEGTDPLCERNDGSLTIYASGGTGALTYSIDGTVFDPSNTFNQLDAGSYTITVMDANSCPNSAPLVLADHPGPELTGTGIDPLCSTASGTIDLAATGGEGNLQFSIYNGDSLSLSGNFNNLWHGTYQIFVIDTNNCSDLGTIELSEHPSPVIIDLTTINPTCGASNGAISVDAQGQAQPFSYSIDSNATSQNGANFSGLLAGVYHVVVSDTNNCTAYSPVDLINADGPVIDAISIINPDCGMNNGQIDLTISGGTSPYLIDFGSGAQGSTSHINLGPGNYNFTVTDSNNCLVFDDTILVAPGGPQIDLISKNDPISCLGNEGSITISAQSTGPQLLYSIDGGVNFTDSPLFSSLPSGNYSAVVKYALGNCEVNDLISLSDPVGDPFIPITFAPLCDGTPGEVIITELVPEREYTLSFVYDNELIEATEVADEFGYIRFLEMNPGAYNDFSLIAPNKCETVFDDVVEMHEIIDTCMHWVKIPNVFTPNGDRINDTWDIHGLEHFPDAVVKIYNRWGNVIYKDNANIKPWNGKNGRGVLVPVGTYYFTLDLREVDGSGQQKFSGDLTIMR